MPVFAPDDLLRVSSRLEFEGKDDLMNVWFFRVNGAGTITDADFRTACQNWLDGIFNPMNAALPASGLLPKDLKIDRVHYDVGTAKIVTDATLYLGSWVMQQPFGGAGEALPLQDSAVVALRTTRPKSKGKRFLPVFVESQSAHGGILTAGAKVLVQAAAAAMLVVWPAPALALGITPGIVSKYAPLPYFYPFVQAVVTDYLCTQRRRRAGVGG